MSEVVSNTGPLIALAGIGRFSLLHDLFVTIHIPAAVFAEVQDETSRAALASANWLKLRTISSPLAVQILRDELDAGESEAIVLATELQAGLLLVDERAATAKARNRGLTTIGTLGVLLMAKEQGCLAAVKPAIDDLRRAGFHMSESLYHMVLASAGEE
ncbi:MAG: DUF3368 domain-containing protein [Caldilinea sp.]|nr:DUF3368 domain-containing protein [Caldilinea sp.]MCO5211981.1 DUF3368 domain-containing protein [Caldilinea sp.]MCW5841783.1 DUF3368 domain-containing protein [Caldilinea sp.]